MTFSVAAVGARDPRTWDREVIIGRHRPRHRVRLVDAPEAGRATYSTFQPQRAVETGTADSNPARDRMTFDSGRNEPPRLICSVQSGTARRQSHAISSR